MTPVTTLALVTVALLGGYALLHVLGQRWSWSAELRRKAVHVSLGLVCLSFPWLFDDSWPVVVLGAIAVVALLVLRLIPRGEKSLASNLHGISRFSLGELVFPVVVVWVFLAAEGNLALYTVPIAILTLADAGGALVGIRYGRKRFSTFGCDKTFEGSLTFFVIAVVCTLGPLMIFTELSWTTVLVIALILAGLATLVEGFSSHGLDNLLLPIVSLLILEVFLTLPPEHLLVRLGALAVVVVVLTLARKRSTLDGGGLLSCMLFGYACHALGNVLFLGVAMITFGFHVLVSARVKKTHHVEHRVDTVAAIVWTGLVWLSLNRLETLPPETALLCFSLGMAAHLTMMHCGTQIFLGAPKPGYSAAVLKGSFLVALGFLGAALVSPVAEGSWQDWSAPLIFFLGFVALLFPTAALFVAWRGPRQDSRSLYYLKESILALPYSALGLLAGSLS